MNPPMLRAEGLRKTFADPAGGPEVVALDDLDFSLDAGECIGILGSSGAGKSTLVKVLLGLERPDAGRVFFEGEDVLSGPNRAPKSYRGRVQVVFQDPRSSLNPHLSVATIVAEPLLATSRCTRQRRRASVREALARVDLDETVAARRAEELSGGERQRVAFARALIADPDVLLLDEPLSALDSPVRAHLLAVLDQERRRRTLSLLVVSHDVRVISKLADRALVLERGRCIEEGEVGRILSRPEHPVTRGIMEAVPRLPVVVMGSQ